MIFSLRAMCKAYRRCAGVNVRERLWGGHAYILVVLNGQNTPSWEYLGASSHHRLNRCISTSCIYGSEEATEILQNLSKEDQRKLKVLKLGIDFHRLSNPGFTFQITDEEWLHCLSESDQHQAKRNLIKRKIDQHKEMKMAKIDEENEGNACEATMEKDLSAATMKKEVNEATTMKKCSAATMKKETSEATIHKEPNEATMEKELSEATLKREPMKNEPSKATMKKEPGEATMEKEPGEAAEKTEPSEANLNEKLWLSPSGMFLENYWLRKTILWYQYNKAIMCKLYGQRVVFDCDFFESEADLSERFKLVVNSYMKGLSSAQSGVSCVHLIFCNMKDSSLQLVKNSGNKALWAEFMDDFITISSRSYLDLIPRDDLIYLIPGGRKYNFPVITTYNARQVFIFNVNSTKSSLHHIKTKNKEEKIVLVKMPVHLRYRGLPNEIHKYLHPEYVMNILSTLHHTGSWERAMQTRMEDGGKETAMEIHSKKDFRKIATQKEKMHIINTKLFSMPYKE